jgi:mRNA interferase MazF
MNLENKKTKTIFKYGVGMMERMIRRGDIYLADLSPVVGCEEGGVRPIYVLSNNLGNKHAPVITAAAISSTTKRMMPTHYKLEARKHGVERDSIIMLEQIRTIDKNRLNGYLTSIDPQTMKEIDKVFMLSCGLLVPQYA